MADDNSKRKVVIVTGANAGLGFELSRQLYLNGYEVILACRNLSRGEDAVNRLKDLCPDANGQLTLMQLDLADLQSVRDFVSKFQENYETLSVLVNNAGLDGTENREETKDGFELTIGVNHLGHVLLTMLLLDTLKAEASKSGEARIVVVASTVHIYGKRGECIKFLNPMDFDDLMLEKKNAYAHLQAYRNSKAMNVMFTMKLHRLLAGTNVSVNCICPGFVPDSDLSRNIRGCMRCLFSCFRCFATCVGRKRTLQTAGGHMFDLCDNPKMEGVSGHWYVDGRQRDISEEARNEENQETIWTWSLERCGL